MKRAAVKYCGGCDPVYERVEWVKKVEEAGGQGIRLERYESQDDFDVVLLVNGCERECAAVGLGRGLGGVTCISVTRGDVPPEQVAGWILTAAVPADP